MDSKYDSSRQSSGYYDDIKAAAIDRHELEKIQFQVRPSFFLSAKLHYTQQHEEFYPCFYHVNCDLGSLV